MAIDIRKKNLNESPIGNKIKKNPNAQIVLYMNNNMQKPFNPFV